MAKKPTYEELEQRIRELEIKQDACKIIEKNLLIEKQFSESVINSLPGIFYLYDEKGKLYRWNKNLEKVSGYSFEEISKMTPYDFFEQEDKKIAADTIKEVFKKGKSSVELDVVSKSGKKTPYYLTGVRTNIGKASYLVGMGIDITKLKQVEEALATRNMELNNLADSSPGLMGTFYLRPDGSVCMPYTSPQIENLYGLRSEDVVDDATSLLARTHPDDAVGVNESIAESARTMTPWRHEFRVIHPTRGEIWLEGSTNPRPHPDGGVIWYGFIYDITERKRTEDLIKDEVIRRRILVEQSRDGIVVLEESGKVYEANQRFSDMLGYSMEEVHQLHVWEWDNHFTKEQVMEMARTVDDTGDYFETVHRRKDGTLYDVEISTNGAVYRGQKLIFCICRDITERKQAEEVLRESAEYHRIITSTSMDGFVVTNSRGKFLDVNEVYCQMLGYSRDELLKMSVADVEGIESPDEIHRHIKKITEKGSDRFETRQRRKDGRIIDVEVSMNPIQQKDLQLNFVRDITDRKRAEVTIRESEEKYRQLFETNEVLLTVCDRRGVCQLMNRRVAALHGGEPKDFIGKSLKELHPKAGEDYIRAIQETMDLGISREIEDEVEFFQGKRWLLSRMQPVPDAKGVFRTVQIISQDITERKQAEEALQASQERLSLVIEGSNDGFWDWNLATGQAYFSPRYYTMLGYAPDEFPATYESWQSLIHPEDLAATEKTLRQHFEEKLPAYAAELRLRTRSGDYRWILTRGKVVERDAEGKVVRMSGTHSDITERKLAENTLKEKEESYRTLSENLPGMVYRVYLGKNNRMEFFNDMLETMTGYQDKELIQGQICNIDNLILPEDRSLVLQSVKDAILKDKTFEVEYRVKHKNGDIKYFLERGRPIYGKDGKPLHIDGVILDQTDRKHVEKTLQVEREQLLSIFNSINEIVYVADPETYEILYANDFLIETFKKNLVGGICYKEFQELDSPCDFCTNEIILKNKYRSHQYEHHNPVLNRDFIITDRIIKWPDGRDVRFEICIENTERKQAEAALLREKHFSDTLIDSMPGIFSVFDEHGRHVRWNKRLESITGYFAEELSHMKPTDFVVGEGKDYVSRKFQEVLTKGEARAEASLMTKGGRTIPYYFTGVRIVIGGKPHLLGIGLDISDRKQAEEALRESEARFSKLSEATWEAIAIHDRGVLLQANDQYYQMYGYEPAELLGKQTISITATPESVKTIRKHINSGGNAGPYEVTGIRKDGTEFPKEVRSKMIEYSGEKVRVAAIRDITERKQAENELRKRKAELKIQSQHLQEVNSALKVLLRQREEDKKELQESVVANVEELIFPYLEKLSQTMLDDRYRAYINIIQSNLNDIISPFIGVLSSRFMRLTPTEVQVANFIKHGKTTKEIAGMLNLSVETIKFHRKNIRDKLGIKNKKANLRTQLLSVQ